jgi:hypothetical protein
MRRQIVMVGWMVWSVACAVAAETPWASRYHREQLTERAGFEPSYNFPVHL